MVGRIAVEKEDDDMSNKKIAFNKQFVNNWCTYTVRSIYSIIRGQNQRRNSNRQKMSKNLVVRFSSNKSSSEYLFLYNSIAKGDKTFRENYHFLSAKFIFGFHLSRE